MELVLTLAVVFIPMGLNIWATWLVVNDSLTEGKQKAAQLAVVWILPVIGAVVTLAVHRKNEPPSRRYREPAEPGDNFARSGMAVKTLRQAIDDE